MKIRASEVAASKMDINSAREWLWGMACGHFQIGVQSDFQNQGVTNRVFSTVLFKVVCSEGGQNPQEQKAPEYFLKHRCFHAFFVPLKGFTYVASRGEESENTVWKTPFETLRRKEGLFLAFWLQAKQGVPRPTFEKGIFGGRKLPHIPDLPPDKARVQSQTGKHNAKMKRKDNSFWGDGGNIAHSQLKGSSKVSHFGKRLRAALKTVKKNQAPVSLRTIST